MSIPRGRRGAKIVQQESVKADEQSESIENDTGKTDVEKKESQASDSASDQVSIRQQ